MQSILIPSDILISISKAPRSQIPYIKRQGPRGIFIKKGGDFTLSKLKTHEGSRIFVSGVSPQQESIILGQLWKQARGLSLGYRKRLRLVGIGFRGIIQKKSSIFESNFKKSSVQKRMIFPKHRIRESDRNQNSSTIANSIPSNIPSTMDESILLLKLGYSHECGFPLGNIEKNNIKIAISRLEGRTKGTVISMAGSSLVQTSSLSTELQKFRIPDVYKGKGIHKDGIKLSFKKGKRQG